SDVCSSDRPSSRSRRRKVTALLGERLMLTGPPGVPGSTWSEPSGKTAPPRLSDGCDSGVVAVFTAPHSTGRPAVVRRPSGQPVDQFWVSCLWCIRRTDHGPDWARPGPHGPPPHPAARDEPRRREDAAQPRPASDQTTAMHTTE